MAALDIILLCVLVAFSSWHACVNSWPRPVSVCNPCQPAHDTCIASYHVASHTTSEHICTRVLQ